METNLIKEILDPKVPKSGKLKKEADVFREMEEGTSAIPEEEKLYPRESVDFYLYNSDSGTPGSNSLKLAADSSLIVEKPDEKISFYISKDESFALRLYERTDSGNKQVYAALVVKNSNKNSDVLLYCKETSRYYTTGENLEFLLSGFTSSEFTNYSFQLIYPRQRYFCFRDHTGDRLIIVHPGEMSINLIYKLTEDEYTFSYQDESAIKAAVIKTDNYSGVFSASEYIFKIPKSLIKGKTEILIF